MKEKNKKLSKSMMGNQNSVGNNGGRPSEYNSKYCEDIIEFFSRKPYDILMMMNEDTGKEEPVINKHGNAVLIPCDLPTFEGFAIHIGVSRQTLHNWCDAYPEFLYAYTRAKDFQKEILIQNGLHGNYEKQFAIFTAKNVTDMKDKQEVDNISSDGSMTPTKIERVIVDVKDTDS